MNANVVITKRYEVTRFGAPEANIVREENDLTWRRLGENCGNKPRMELEGLDENCNKALELQ